MTWTADVWAWSGFCASPNTRRATVLWRRTVTLGGPGPRAVTTRDRAAAPLSPRAPAAVHCDSVKIDQVLPLVSLILSQLEKYRRSDLQR